MYIHNTNRISIFLGLFVFHFSILITAQEIEIMTYNIHHGADANEIPTIDSIGKYIKESTVQIVGLQEVDSVCIRSDKRDHPAELGKMTGLESHFTRHFPFQGGAYGQGLLSKYTAVNLQNISIPILPLSSGKSVSMLVADLEITPGKELTIAVVHLDYRNQASRLNQIEMIWEVLQNKNRNLILMGDINAMPGSPALKLLSKSFDRFQQNPEPYSFPADNPDRRIDFVFVRKGSDLKITNERIDRVPYSDHLPVITTIVYN